MSLAELNSTYASIGELGELMDDLVDVVELNSAKSAAAVEQQQDNNNNVANMRGPSITVNNNLAAVVSNYTKDDSNEIPSLVSASLSK